MACRTAQLIALVCAIVALMGAACRRAPLSKSKPDAAVDQAPGMPGHGDGGGATADLLPEAGGDAPNEVPTDVPAELPTDVPADVGVPDRAGADGSDARPEDQPCGPQGFHCNPYACDVALGLCKTTCASDDDCSGRRTCLRGQCGSWEPFPCGANEECNSGFCAQGVCCQTACDQTCRSCAVAGSVGICSPVPIGADPLHQCPAGSVCNGLGGCVRTCTTATVATDCGRGYSCSNGRCLACAATCVTGAECASGYCVDNNGCTYCRFTP